LPLCSSAIKSERLELGALIDVGPAVLANDVSSYLLDALGRLLARLADHFAAVIALFRHILM
jgi:hypothetical protein